jgi:hypothetical protein
MDQSPSGDPAEPNPAYTGAILIADVNPDQLFAWYGRVLTKAGFRPAPYFRPSDQTSGESWQFHHRLQVQVGIFDPTLLRSEAGLAIQVPPGETLYQAVLVGYAPGLPRF